MSQRRVANGGKRGVGPARARSRDPWFETEDNGPGCTDVSLNAPQAVLFTEGHLGPLSASNGNDTAPSPAIQLRGGRSTGSGRASGAGTVIREMPKNFRNLLPLCPSEAEKKQTACVWKQPLFWMPLASAVAASFPLHPGVRGEAGCSLPPGPAIPFCAGCASPSVSSPRP